MTPEGKVKARVKEILEQYHVWYFFPRGTVRGRAGIPDIIACLNGQFIAIECKAGHNHITPLQRREIVDIRMHGGSALVVNEYNYDDLETLLQETRCTKQAKTLSCLTSSKNWSPESQTQR